MLQNAPNEHSAILSTFIKLPFVFKTFVLSIFECPLKTGFTVQFQKFFSNLTLLHSEFHKLPQSSHSECNRVNKYQ